MLGYDEQCRECRNKHIYPAESGGTTQEVLVMRTEEQPLDSTNIRKEHK